MSPSDPQAILFDLDDTIIDYGGSTEPAWRTVCNEAAAATASVDAATLFDTINAVRQWYWSDPDRHREGRADLRAASRRIVLQALRALGVDRPDLAHTIAERYRDLRDLAIELVPDAVDTLERFRQRGVRLGLVTNGTSTDQRAKIERFDLARHFDRIIIEGEFGCGKPDARVYHAALAGVGTPAHSTWFVGDNLEWDVAGPQRLGLIGIWIDGARKGLPVDTAVRPDRIIHSLADLLR